MGALERAEVGSDETRAAPARVESDCCPVAVVADGVMDTCPMTDGPMPTPTMPGCPGRYVPRGELEREATVDFSM